MIIAERYFHGTAMEVKGSTENDLISYNDVCLKKTTQSHCILNDWERNNII